MAYCFVFQRKGENGKIREGVKRKFSICNGSPLRISAGKFFGKDVKDLLFFVPLCRVTKMKFCLKFVKLGLKYLKISNN